MRDQQIGVSFYFLNPDGIKGFRCLDKMRWLSNHIRESHPEVSVEGIRGGCPLYSRDSIYSYFGITGLTNLTELYFPILGQGGVILPDFLRHSDPEHDSLAEDILRRSHGKFAGLKDVANKGNPDLDGYKRIYYGPIDTFLKRFS